MAKLQKALWPGDQKNNFQWKLRSKSSWNLDSSGRHSIFSLLWDHRHLFNFIFWWKVSRQAQQGARFSTPKVTQKRMWQSHSIYSIFYIEGQPQPMSLQHHVTWQNHPLPHKINTQTKIIQFHSKASWCALICSGLVATYVWLFLKYVLFFNRCLLESNKPFWSGGIFSLSRPWVYCSTASFHLPSWSYGSQVQCLGLREILLQISHPEKNDKINGVSPGDTHHLNCKYP